MSSPGLRRGISIRYKALYFSAFSRRPLRKQRAEYLLQFGGKRGSCKNRLMVRRLLRGQKTGRNKYGILIAKELAARAVPHAVFRKRENLASSVKVFRDGFFADTDLGCG